MQFPTKINTFLFPVTKGYLYLFEATHEPRGFLMVLFAAHLMGHRFTGATASATKEIFPAAQLTWAKF